MLLLTQAVSDYFEILCEKMCVFGRFEKVCISIRPRLYIIIF